MSKIELAIPENYDLELITVTYRRQKTLQPIIDEIKEEPAYKQLTEGEFKCPFCPRKFKNKLACGSHKSRCKSNPDQKSWSTKRKNEDAIQKLVKEPSFKPVKEASKESQYPWGIRTRKETILPDAFKPDQKYEVGAWVWHDGFKFGIIRELTKINATVEFSEGRVRSFTPSGCKIMYDHMMGKRYESL